MQIKKNTLLFLCLPNLGIIDNWLPILWELKKNKEINLVCVFPNPKLITHLDFDSVLIKLANEVFDKFIFLSNHGEWLITSEISETKELNNENKLDSLFQKKLFLIAKEIPLVRRLIRNTENYLNNTQRKRRAPLLQKNLLDWNTNKDHVTGILYDIYTEKKQFSKVLMNYFTDLPKFSMHHGIDIAAEKELKFTGKSGKTRKDVTAYLFSETSRSIYKKKYGLSDDDIQIVGIPRHEPEWLDFIIQKEKEIHNYSPPIEEFVFLISRPTAGSRVSIERRLKSLRDIKRVVLDQLNKKIIVKLHPKERKEGFYEEVFGEENYGVKWEYSNLHSIVLGDHCLFAIAFTSGVVIDMIIRETPSIELLNLKGIPKFDNTKALRDQNGEPVLMYRYFGLAYGASDYTALKKHTETILQDRSVALQVLKKNYSALFPLKKNINMKIADNILTKLKTVH